MKAVCPKNCDHKRFITVVHVTQNWIVDEHGNFIKKYGQDEETVYGPIEGNTWVCETCGETAMVG